MMSLRLCRAGMASFAGPRSFHFNRSFLGQRLILQSPSFHLTRPRTIQRLTVKAEMAGQYGESFDDISKVLYTHSFVRWLKFVFSIWLICLLIKRWRLSWLNYKKQILRVMNGCTISVSNINHHKVIHFANSLSRNDAKWVNVCWRWEWVY